MAKQSRILVALMLAATFPSGVVLADDNGHPLLNSVGRFLGIGYTHHGYHASQGGQLNIVKQNHPAANYRSSHLLAPYHVTSQTPPAACAAPSQSQTRALPLMLTAPQALNSPQYTPQHSPQSSAGVISQPNLPTVAPPQPKPETGPNAAVTPNQSEHILLESLLPTEPSPSDRTLNLLDNDEFSASAAARRTHPLNRYRLQPQK